MPSSPNYTRNYKQEYATEKVRGESGTGTDSENARRHRDRRTALKLGMLKTKQDLDHKTPLSKGGSDKPTNFRAESAHDNRSFPRNADGSLKVNRPKVK